ncbi:hypothetical protein [uncultured Desulfosarcina sp.]|uniref:hypothetical protein n=1 Tax=uncultured Desulfosarcina sp. TaxID=218289 RepID=UPI0029C7DB09|nr:hypothetical protein [uncultured Desulfosarcina sp.]
MTGAVKQMARAMRQDVETGAAPSKNRRVRPARTAMTGVWIALMALFFLQGLFYVWCRVQCVNTGYAIEKEKSRHETLIKVRSTLNIELARLKSPERIETIARTRLGLIMPDAQRTVTLP